MTKQKVNWDKIKARIAKEDKEAYEKSIRGRLVEKAAPKVVKKVRKMLDSKMSNKQVLKKKQAVTVDVSQPVYSKDKSRYFKTAWEEEKKQLYFK